MIRLWKAFLNTLDGPRIAENARRQIAAFDIRPEDPYMPARALSGGNQQKIVVARWLSEERPVLILSEPTAGVDAAGQENLARTLSRLVGQGLTLVVVTHEIEPLLGLLTRVVELREGRVVRDERLPSATAGVDLDVAREGA